MMGEKNAPNRPKASAPGEVKGRREAFRRFVRECTRCQQSVELHWQFCAHCGIRLASRCPSCGNPLPPVGATYCPHCGLLLPKKT